MSKGKRKRRGHFEPKAKATPQKDRKTEELRADLSRLLDPPPDPAGVLSAKQPNPPKVKK